MDIKFKFDPDKSEALAAIINDPVAMSLWAMWKTNHIVSNEFIDDVKVVAHRVRVCRARTEERLHLSFPCRGYDFAEADVRRFVPEWYKVLTGQTKLFFVIGEERREVVGADIWKPNGDSHE